MKQYLKYEKIELEVCNGDLTANEIVQELRIFKEAYSADNSCSSDDVNRVVQGVAIHAYSK